MERHIVVDRRNIWTRRVGRGPAIVLLGGAGQSGSAAFASIEDELAKVATVVTYDRAGLGRSDPPTASPTASDMTDDLQAVLDALDVPKPLLLCGVSLGALPAQLYAVRRPNEVAALLLLDPTPDEMLAAIAEWPAGPQDLARRNLTTGPDITPAMGFEMQELIESSIQVRDTIAEHGLSDVPLIVAALNRPHASPLSEYHNQMARRSSRGRVVTVDGSGHRTFVEDHAMLIIELACELLGRGS
jgi:pimeloyl-ACP methyl ester carboxylesterase